MRSENRDGLLEDGESVQGATVFLDLDFDGERGLNEPFLETDGNGAFAFRNLEPGLYFVRQILPPATLQTAPSRGPTPTGDGLADEVVEYVHTLVGALPEPYGFAAEEFGGYRTIVFPAQPRPIDPELVLKPIGVRGDLPAIGAFSTSEWLTKPEGSTLLLRYDEWLIDGLGDDLLIRSIDPGPQEKVEVSVGPSPDRLTSLGEAVESAGGVTFDLGEACFREPIR